MYNEDHILFVKSLLAIQKNIAYLCSDKCPYSWGPDGWQNFVVVIVSDGKAKINNKVNKSNNKINEIINTNQQKQ